ncbi:Uncharacterised protein [Mycobacteroides abscessus subsp. abscessus]|nr:Uncharacterised protein [Mycobacteroides abscessus subsp. abscessus]
MSLPAASFTLPLTSSTTPLIPASNPLSLLSSLMSRSFSVRVCGATALGYPVVRQLKQP